MEFRDIARVLTSLTPEAASAVRVCWYCFQRVLSYSVPDWWKADG